MPLGDDQKAMLRLLAREQSYEDIAALMGLSVDEVVTRAKGAVEQLEAEGIPAPSLPDAPGGSTAKAPETKAEKPPAPPPPDPAPKKPESVLPFPGSTPGKPAAPRKPRDKNMLLAIGAGVVALIVIVVLAVLLISNSGGDDSSTSTSNAGDTTVAETGSGTRQPTTAQLEAVDGSDASGSAEFGRVKESLALGVRAQGVDPAPEGKIYMVWLADTAQKMLPLTALEANKAGRINASYQVPTEAVVYLASGEFDRMVITLCDNAELRKSLEQANEDKKFPTYTGDPVLEGQIVGPIVGAAERLEKERQK